jgi:hypothetical protein
MSFFFSKTEQGGKTGPDWGWYQWEGEDIRKVCRRVNVVKILCSYVVNGKMRLVETSRNGGKEDKG